MRNCAERPLAVVGEFGDLISGTQHSNFESVTAGSDAPFMRLMYGRGDLLLPADPLVAGAGSLFDEVIPYDGGHVEFVKGSELAQNIFAWDAALMTADMPPAFSQAA
jgi:hypothetical protein